MRIQSNVTPYNHLKQLPLNRFNTGRWKFNVEPNVAVISCVDPDSLKVLDGLIEEDEEVVSAWYLLGWLNYLRYWTTSIDPLPTHFNR